MNYYNENDPKAAAWIQELINQKLIPEGHVDTRSITEVTPADLHPYIQCHFFAGVAGWSYALQLAGVPATTRLWTGSCPCQPFSTAGKGLAQADERHLWPVFFDLIRQCRPEHVFGEQVASAIGHGWLDGVSADLEGAGYACGAAVLGAHSVGAPHIRQRLYWVADAGGERHDGQHTLLRPQAGGRDSGEVFEAAGCSADGWQRVVFSGDTDEDGNCPVCGIDYSECGCPGPTQDDEYEYDERDGILYARRLGHAQQPRLEGHAGHGDNGHEPRRLDADSAGSVAPTGCDCWSNFNLIPCADGKARRIEPGLAPLAHGIPARVVRLRGYGNAIVPQVAAEFIQAFYETQIQEANTDFC